MDREQRVREIAYGLWEEEGCPDGEHERHWLTAESLFNAEKAERDEVRGEAASEAAASFK
ncbi:MAG: DUF2934 domain-containing protein [Hyphomicrobiales bacterium]|nr:DUF2934 domain-containing protein [Hyphomicrobiales bacterium]